MTTIITDQPKLSSSCSSIEPKLLLGPNRTVITCPFCNSLIKTSIKHTTTVRTHIAAALCCWCCCIPLCCNSAKNTDHYCPKCKLYLGTYER